MVGTTRSPSVQRVPIAWVREVLDRLSRDGELEISIASVGYRSAFIGAVLLTIPGAVATSSAPFIRMRSSH